jgi:hypothetical protein
MGPIRGSKGRARGRSGAASPSGAAKEEEVPAGPVGPVRVTPARPDSGTGASRTTSGPDNDGSGSVDNDSLGSGPSGAGPQARFTKKQVRDQVTKITSLLERTKKILKGADIWIEAGALRRDHGLEGTQASLEVVLDLLGLRMRKLEAAKASSTRLVSQATLNQLRRFLDDLTQLTSLDSANLATNWVERRDSLGSETGEVATDSSTPT